MKRTGFVQTLQWVLERLEAVAPLTLLSGNLKLVADLPVRETWKPSQNREYAAQLNPLSHYSTMRDTVFSREPPRHSGICDMIALLTPLPRCSELMAILLARKSARLSQSRKARELSSPSSTPGKGEDYHVFVTIAEAPGKSGDGSTVMALLEELEEDNLDTSAKIARVPREYGDPRTVEPLERVRKRFSELRRQIDAGTRRE